jgi:PAS domain S-box-containing protein
MASPSILPLLGYDSIDELLGKNIASQILQYPEEREALLETLARDGSVTNYDVVLRRRDGSLVTVSTSSHVFFDHEGKPGGVEGIFHDVTAVRAAAQQLQLLAGLIEISPEPSRSCR